MKTFAFVVAMLAIPLGASAQQDWQHPVNGVVEVAGGLKLPPASITFQNELSHPVRLTLPTGIVYVEPHLAKMWQWTSGPGFMHGWLQVDGGTRFAIGVQECLSFSEQDLNPIPGWARDPAYAGPAAITADFAEQAKAAPKQDRFIGERVAQIKKYLDERGEPTRKDMKRRLDEWRKRTEHIPLDVKSAVCNGPQLTLPVSLYASQYAYDNKTVWVRPQGPNRFVVDHPGW